MEKCECAHEGIIATTESFAKQCFKELHGNGRAGLLERTTHLEQRVSNMSEDLSTIAGSVKGLLEYQQSRKAIEMHKSKTVIQATALAGTIISIAAVVVAVIVK